MWRIKSKEGAKQNGLTHLFSFYLLDLSYNEISLTKSILELYTIRSQGIQVGQWN